ncbi:hypothetical protein [Deinococcus aquaticus]|uniref:Uncharacterized protein n=1 Tax=Deinococcus aquaticus TaxID=328692 RepID=A0ABY7V670_9DEIO|nr:hypothetical protein [Deinococcus aquaticus]WDA60691.1 hypothetical protein M8445_17130 [Deinococcus aquaticus]
MTQLPIKELWLVVVRSSPDTPEICYSEPVPYNTARTMLEEAQRVDKIEKVNDTYRLVRAADWK